MTVGEKRIKDAFWIIQDGKPIEVLLSSINGMMATVEIWSLRRSRYRFISLTAETPCYENEYEACVQVMLNTQEEISHLQRRLEVIQQRLNVLEKQ